MRREYITQSDTPDGLVHHYEAVDHEPSATLPDQSMSMRELLIRSARGGEIRQLQPLQTSEEDEIDLSKMDKMEKLELSQVVKSNIKKLQKKVQDNEERKLSQPTQMVIPDQTVQPDLLKKE